MVEEGQEIYGYKVKRFLGKGSFGQAYSVEHIATKKVMAMKVIDITSVNEDEYANTVKIMEREISTGLKLSPLSPFLLQLSEFFVSKKYFYIVMEFCSGGDLQKVFNKKNKLPRKEVVKLTFHLANGLKVLHNGGTMHRDLKPSNIFITSDEIYKIGDFGTACVIDLEKYTTLVGTTGYMAPEVLNGEKYDSKVDIFSLGCVLYEAITGRNPFMNENGKIVIGKNTTATFQKIEVSDCPSELVDLCHSMLSLSPFDRPSAEDILQNSIFGEIIDNVFLENNRLKEEIITLKKIFEKNNNTIKDKNNTIKEMEKGIKDKDNTIQNLTQENNQLKERVNNMKEIKKHDWSFFSSSSTTTFFSTTISSSSFSSSYECTKCGRRVNVKEWNEFKDEECPGHK